MFNFIFLLLHSIYQVKHFSHVWAQEKAKEMLKFSLSFYRNATSSCFVQQSCRFQNFFTAMHAKEPHFKISQSKRVTQTKFKPETLTTATVNVKDMTIPIQ